MTKTMETALSLARYLSIQFSGNEKLLVRGITLFWEDNDLLTFGAGEYG